jgi:hypothetical protein
VKGMEETPKHRDSLGEVSFPPEVEEALEQVSELPEDPEEQAEFYDKVQEALATRLQDDT